MPLRRAPTFHGPAVIRRTLANQQQLRQLRIWHPQSKAWLLLVFGTALFLRVLYVLLQVEFAVFDVSFEAADTRLYRTLAENLFRYGRFQTAPGEPTAFVTPGYPLLLAGLFAVGRSTLFIALVQSVMGAATILFLALTAERLGGRAAGIATGLTAAFYPHLIFWTGYVLTETFYVFLVAVAIFLVARVVNDETPGRWLPLIAGITSGAAALVRPTILAFPLLLGIVGAFSTRWRGRALLGAVGVLLVLAPWVIRNMVVLDAPVVTSTESGFVLWQGNSPGATGGTRGYVDQQDFRPLDFPPGTSEVERDAIYAREALSWMVSHPLEVAGLVPKKLWNMFRPTYEDASLINRTVTYLTYPLLLLGGAYGLILLRHKGVLAWILIAVVAYHLVVHGLVTGMIRFRLPVEAILTIPFGIAVVQLIQGRRSG